MICFVYLIISPYTLTYDGIIWAQGVLVVPFLNFKGMSSPVMTRSSLKIVTKMLQRDCMDDAISLNAGRVFCVK
jgi:hypothetical protein